jgi:hypothetical protein
MRNEKRIEKKLSNTISSGNKNPYLNIDTLKLQLRKSHLDNDYENIH